ncbi:hypothetical protein LCGC14_0970460 [marine sediment metagenome]|uniref:Uncharacterized protein n=1 Tax=marine sediment metagenome TaxID=412755 RepID=A0A0F9QUY4_9ZZZZ
MYKDPDKQREANRLAQAKFKSKGITKGITKSRVLPEGITFDDNGDVHVPDKVFTKLMAQAKPGHIRVSKPGDSDYVPMCKPTRIMAQHNWKKPGEVTYIA